MFAAASGQGVAVNPETLPSNLPAVSANSLIRSAISPSGLIPRSIDSRHLRVCLQVVDVEPKLTSPCGTERTAHNHINPNPEP